MTLSPGAKQIPRADDPSCRACLPCAARAVCPTKAIRAIDRDEAPFIDAHLCMGCHACVAACPFEAIVRPVVVKV